MADHAADDNFDGESLSSELSILFRGPDLLSEERLHEIFRRFGGVLIDRLKRPNANDHNNITPSSYGFFYEACINERITEGMIEYLLEYFPNAAQGGLTGSSPLHWACTNKNVTLNIIQLLINAAPGSVFRADSEGWMPLHVLCMNRQQDDMESIETLNLLLEKYPEAVLHADNSGNLPIHYACESKFPEFCQVLIEAAPDSVRSTNNYGLMPLHILCNNNQVDEGTMQTLNFLLEEYPEAVWHAVNDGTLPIHIASVTKSPEFCQILIEAAPDSVHSTNKYGWMPLHYLCGMRELNENTAIQTLNFLLEEYPEAALHADDHGRLPIHLASCRGGSPEFCQALIDAASDSVRKEDKYGWMPLHTLSDNPEVDGVNAMQTLKFLIEKYPGAVLHADNNGSLPIHLASVTKSPEFCQVLIDAAPDSIRSKDKNGWSPLHFLCGVTRVGVNAIQTLQLLIENDREAVRQVCTNSGRLPIHDAILLRSPEFCRLLIEAYPGSERRTTTNGELPLHLACLDGSPATVEYMYGLYPDAIDATVGGYYPIHYAILCSKHREIVQFLLDCDPDQKLKQFQGKSLIHVVCAMYNNGHRIRAGIEIINVIFEAQPASVRSVNYEGRMPLHSLCINRKVDEAAAMQILKFLLEKYPEAVRHADNDGYLPIHLASRLRSPEFCRLLIEAHPGSERRTTTNGELPLHLACALNTLPTVEYMYGLYPDAIGHAATQGHHPIHKAIRGAKRRDNPADAVKIVQFLLDCDPNQKLIQFREESLFDFACRREYGDSNVDANIDAGIQVVKIIFDAHPEAIEDIYDFTVQYYDRPIQPFVNNQLVHARLAKNHRLMMTPDDNGQLPLHTALQNNVRLGSIKLLVNGNPSAIRTIDKNGMLPLHVACKHHDSACVVGYIVSLADETLDTIDRQGNTALHYACLGAKYQTIALLLEKYDAVSVSRRNAHKKLPIELLWESNAVKDRGSFEYTDSVFRLLKAFPDTLTSTDMTQSFARLRI